MKIDQFQGNSNCEKSMKARTNLRPSMESLMPGLQFEEKLFKLVEIWFTTDKNTRVNFFWDTLYTFCEKSFFSVIILKHFLYRYNNIYCELA